MTNALIETLGLTVEILDAENIRYAITGSVASSVHGEPCVSQDVDLILQASEEKAAAIARRLPARFYGEEDMLVDAARRLSLTNLVDNRTGLKVDLSFVPTDGYLDEVLGRCVESRIGSAGPVFRFATAEDVILMKLLWRKDTRSQKQWENALGVVRVQGARLDWKYLFEQARKLGLEEDLVALRDEGGV